MPSRYGEAKAIKKKTLLMFKIFNRGLVFNSSFNPDYLVIKFKLQ